MKSYLLNHPDFGTAFTLAHREDLVPGAKLLIVDLQKLVCDPRVPFREIAEWLSILHITEGMVSYRYDETRNPEETPCVTIGAFFRNNTRILLKELREVQERPSVRDTENVVFLRTAAP